MAVGEDDVCGVCILVVARACLLRIIVPSTLHAHEGVDAILTRHLPSAFDPLSCHNMLTSISLA